MENLRVIKYNFKKSIQQVQELLASIEDYSDKVYTLSIDKFGAVNISCDFNRQIIKIIKEKEFKVIHSYFSEATNSHFVWFQKDEVRVSMNGRRCDFGNMLTD